jgi:UrcA family protein
MYRLTSSITISVLALILFASARSEPDVPHVVVHFADLDLARIEGATTLYHRLHAAAEVVCWPRQERDLVTAAAFTKCVQGALANAVMRVDRASLTTYYRTHTELGNPVARSRT